MIKLSVFRGLSVFIILFAVFSHSISAKEMYDLATQKELLEMNPQDFANYMRSVRKSMVLMSRNPQKRFFVWEDLWPLIDPFQPPSCKADNGVSSRNHPYTFFCRYSEVNCQQQDHQKIMASIDAFLRSDTQSAWKARKQLAQSYRQNRASGAPRVRAATNAARWYFTEKTKSIPHIKQDLHLSLASPGQAQGEATFRILSSNVKKRFANCSDRNQCYSSFVKSSANLRKLAKETFPESSSAKAQKRLARVFASDPWAVTRIGSYNGPKETMHSRIRMAEVPEYRPLVFGEDWNVQYRGKTRDHVATWQKTKIGNQSVYDYMMKLPAAQRKMFSRAVQTNPALLGSQEHLQFLKYSVENQRSDVLRNASTIQAGLQSYRNLRGKSIAPIAQTVGQVPVTASKRVESAFRKTVLPQLSTKGQQNPISQKAFVAWMTRSDGSLNGDRYSSFFSTDPSAKDQGMQQRRIAVLKKIMDSSSFAQNGKDPQKVFNAVFQPTVSQTTVLTPGGKPIQILNSSQVSRADRQAFSNEIVSLLSSKSAASELAWSHFQNDPTLAGDIVQFQKSEAYKGYQQNFKSNDEMNQFVRSLAHTQPNDLKNFLDFDKSQDISADSPSSLHRFLSQHPEFLSTKELSGTPLVFGGNFLDKLGKDKNSRKFIQEVMCNGGSSSSCDTRNHNAIRSLLKNGHLSGGFVENQGTWKWLKDDNDRAELTRILSDKKHAENLRTLHGGRSEQRDSGVLKTLSESGIPLQKLSPIIKSQSFSRKLGHNPNNAKKLLDGPRLKAIVNAYEKGSEKQNQNMSQFLARVVSNDNLSNAFASGSMTHPQFQTVLQNPPSQRIMKAVGTSGQKFSNYVQMAQHEQLRKAMNQNPQLVSDQRLATFVSQGEFAKISDTDLQQRILKTDKSTRHSVLGKLSSENERTGLLELLKHKPFRDKYFKNAKKYDPWIEKLLASDKSLIEKNGKEIAKILANDKMLKFASKKDLEKILSNPQLLAKAQAGVLTPIDLAPPQTPQKSNVQKVAKKEPEEPSPKKINGTPQGTSSTVCDPRRQARHGPQRGCRKGPTGNSLQATKKARPGSPAHRRRVTPSNDTGSSARRVSARNQSPAATLSSKSQAPTQMVPTKKKTLQRAPAAITKAADIKCDKSHVNGPRCMVAGWVPLQKKCEPPLKEFQFQMSTDVTKPNAPKVSVTLKCQSRKQFLCNPLVFGFQGDTSKIDANQQEAINKNVKGICVSSGGYDVTERCAQKAGNNYKNVYAVIHGLHHGSKKAQGKTAKQKSAPKKKGSQMWDGFRKNFVNMCDTKTIECNRHLNERKKGQRSMAEAKDDVFKTCKAARGYIKAANTHILSNYRKTDSAIDSYQLGSLTQEDRMQKPKDQWTQRQSGAE